MRRKAGSLVPLERAICEAAVVLKSSGVEEFHGFLIAKQVNHEGDVRRLTAYGTLYRALSRLENMGLLASRFEDPLIAAAEHRPLRRLYTLTTTGEAAVRETSAAATFTGKPVEGLA